MKKYLKVAGAVIVVIILGIQLVPVERTNPPVVRDVAWDSPDTRALAERACFDCHSNETKWPYYAYIAPISWRVAQHVSMGRQHLNFSDWTQPNEDLDEVIEVMEDGEMPLSDYLRMHSEARLSPEETEALIAGFKRTFENDPPIERRRRRPPGDGA